MFYAVSAPCPGLLGLQSYCLYRLLHSLHLYCMDSHLEAAAMGISNDGVKLLPGGIQRSRRHSEHNLCGAQPHPRPAVPEGEAFLQEARQMGRSGHEGQGRGEKTLILDFLEQPPPVNGVSRRGVLK